MGHGSETQLQVGENLNYLFNSALKGFSADDADSILYNKNIAYIAYVGPLGYNINPMLV